MLYSLYAPMWDTDDINKGLRKLLKEVLGYNEDEIKILESEHFDRNIANNLTIEQAKEISEIFFNSDIQIYLNDGTGDEGTIYWNQLGISLSHNPPKSHYCDEPLVSREHLEDLSIPKKAAAPARYVDTKPIVECPYCHSTNTKKITNTSKAMHTALFGVFSFGRNNKQFHCNNCKADF